mmetsp:Transcript_7514/g.22217  ORF Transcript_7514/g.22217 Transcript_7514/m.22217 type:complete len:589 (+) Transcript_7514:146-1912(+)|eukprot:CAMPEP_0206152432 /NCGR_PEP_ID=MMETSP1473-20131121/39323_1 /ASSEMBLY_ACC=CAM_ASM_001109 /TAXON_ID=1461547 /ORGANISM="Stichococcus sp, Strain RCC1054" /LENGTH=588 /DNA_ID=CAMNT_0053549991 /DNA_START=61 /DNA_END=1827 /DNA_ORIENTATION=-
MGDEHKAKGNAAFAAGDFEAAIEHFSAGIAEAPESHVLYSNRSACKASLKDYDGALEDAKKVVEIKPDWPKGYSRLGGALAGLQQWDEAKAAYEKGLSIDPENQGLKQGLAEAETAQSGGGNGGGAGLGGMFGPQFMAKLAMDSRTRGFLAQPDFQAMLRDLSSNPNSLSKYMNDPRFQTALSVGMGMNIMTGDQFAADPDAAMGGGGGPGGAGGAAPPSSTSNGSSDRATPPPKQSEPEAEPMSQEEQATAKQKADAQAEKELGNAAYKKKDFEAALQHYGKALELYDGDISFLTNRAAVHFEMADYDATIKDCEAAVERGRELRADFKMVARALTRKGNALVKKGDLPAAIATYNKALTEHRNADTLARLQAAEKALKQQQEDAYVDMDKSNEEKELGNADFKAGRFPEAVKHYTEAMKRGPARVNPELHKLYSNRAACYHKLGAFPEGLKDAEECIKLEPTFVKGYIRKGGLEFVMKDYDAALVTYGQGLKVEPDNQELKDGERRTIFALNQSLGGEGMTDEERKLKQQKAMADPEIQQILTDPIMRQVLDDFSQDPAAAQRHLKQPEIMAKIQKLVKAGIVKLG